MAAFIILHQAVFLLACVFLNEFAVFPIILQRPAEVTREYIDAYFAAPDAPEVILYGLQFFELASWAAFVLWALGNIVPWRELAPKEKKTDAAAMSACAALMLIMCIYFRFFYGGLIYMPMNLIPTELLSLMCAAMLCAKRRYRGVEQIS